MSEVMQNHAAEGSRYPDGVRLILDAKSEEERLERLHHYLRPQDKDELLTVAGDLLDRIHGERTGSLGGTPETWLIYQCQNALDAVMWHIGQRVVEDRFWAEELRRQHELRLIDDMDADGLYQNGFLDEEGYRWVKELFAP